MHKSGCAWTVEVTPGGVWAYGVTWGVVLSFEPGTGHDLRLDTSKLWRAGVVSSVRSVDVSDGSISNNDCR